MSPKAWSRFCWFLILYTVVIILWGAFVRFSGSGDGCGKHWPFCHGYIVPRGEIALQIQTWIEYFHRAKSGLLGLFIFAAGFLAWRQFPRRHPARWAGVAAVFFTLTEGALGAWLVLAGLVQQNDSPTRFFAIGLHLTNTLLLMASLVALLITTTQNLEFRAPRARVGWTLAAGLVLFLILGATGSVASLSNTLFPTTSLIEGMRADFSPDSPWMVRARVLHPFLGMAIAALLAGLAWSAPAGRPWRRRSFVLLVVTPLFGLATLLSLSPLWMKLGHLLLAHATWFCLVALALQDLLEETPRRT
jgi:heme A synthase